MKNEITMIPIGMLVPHPDNPRKNTGDISNLANSIKQSGVMQNLTVVPYENKFRVIIGHRRLAAAKEAGLKELPCVISNMNFKEQCATMLAENMQRVDLTPVEQAQGVQMMLDLGETVEQIAEKTGFSKSTISKRAKIAKLPYERLKNAEYHGGTMQEYLKIIQNEGKHTVDIVDSAVDLVNEIEKIPEVKIPKRHGKWLNFYGDFSAAECSVCGELFDNISNEVSKGLYDLFYLNYKFCPNCGARMDRKEENND